MDIVSVLEAVDVSVENVGSDRRPPQLDALLEIGSTGTRDRLAVEFRKRSPYPGEIHRLEPTREMLAVFGIPTLAASYISESTGKALTEAGWSWVDEQGNADLRIPGLRVQRRVGGSPPPRRTRRLPSGEGSWAILRRLAEDGEVAGVSALAAAVGVSQPRVSQVLRRLENADLVERRTRSRWTVDRAELLDTFLDEYPGPGGSTRWFSSLAQPAALYRAIRDDLAEAAVSGDVAADLVTGWKAPARLTLYIRTSMDVGSWEVVAARGPDDANVQVIMPSDGSVFLRSSLTPPQLVHPTQVIWDLLDHGGSDRAEAAERMRTWLLSR